MTNLFAAAKLSTRRADVREAIVKQIFDVCHVYGACCEVYRDRSHHPREVNMRIDTGRLAVSFTINSLIQEPNVFVLPWVSQKMMSAMFGPEVNPHHGRKATKVFYTISDLVNDIDRMLSLDRAGEACLRDDGKI